MAFPLVQPGRLLLQQYVPMRDGVRLAADVWLPPAKFGPGPYPVLVARSQHGTEIRHSHRSPLTSFRTHPLQTTRPAHMVLDNRDHR